MVFSKSKPLVTTAETPLVARLAALVIALAARFPTAVPAATIPVVRSALENESPNLRPASPPSRPAASDEPERSLDTWLRIGLDDLSIADCASEARFWARATASKSLASSLAAACCLRIADACASDKAVSFEPLVPASRASFSFSRATLSLPAASASLSRDLATVSEIFLT
ncbi:Uncharacterised protein [Mycobacteroides abscessus subsp. abscessus]|nr:Uncharacterised protein [Mycobacteroides abscessus subsp. abscessus]